jgi:hypothetical protein
MQPSTIAPPTNAERIARIRDHHALPTDLEWLRAERVERIDSARRAELRCDCRCHCHASSAITSSEAVRCGLAIDLDSLDCYRACRASHLLAGECNLDETRADVVSEGFAGHGAHRAGSVCLECERNA